MNNTFKETIWRQLGAAVDTLENAIRACPDEVWGDQSGFHEFWYMAYHTIFFLDFYLSDSPEGFAPPEPFTLSELDPEGKLPDRVYSKQEMMTYLAYSRKKARERLRGLAEKEASRPSAFRKGLTVLEMYLYVMRHVQHHAAQLNLLLRQRTDSAPGWVSRARD